MNTYYKKVMCDIHTSFCDGDNKLYEETYKRECTVCMLCNYTTYYGDIFQHLIERHRPDCFAYDDSHRIVCRLCGTVECNVVDAKIHESMHAYYEHILPAEKCMDRYACKTCREEFPISMFNHYAYVNMRRHVKQHETEKQRVIMYNALVSKGIDPFSAQEITQQAYPIRKFL